MCLCLLHLYISCYDTLLIAPSTEKSSVVYLLQLLNGNTINLQGFFCFFLWNFQKSLFTLRWSHRVHIAHFCKGENPHNLSLWRRARSDGSFEAGSAQSSAEQTAILPSPYASALTDFTKIGVKPGTGCSTTAIINLPKPH